MIFFRDEILNLDASRTPWPFPDASVNCIVTSPPYYGLRDYGIDGQIGHEKTPEIYIKRLVRIFSECRRILKDDGTMWINIGDSYCATGTGSGDQGSSTLGGGKKNQVEAGMGKRFFMRKGRPLQPDCGPPFSKLNSTWRHQNNRLFSL